MILDYQILIDGFTSMLLAASGPALLLAIVSRILKFLLELISGNDRVKL